MDVPEYSKMTLTELKYHADLRHVRYVPSIKKAKLIESLILSHKIEQARINYLERKELEKIQKEKEEQQHRGTRITELRQQSEVDPKVLEYPYLFLEDYDLTPKPIPGQEAVEIGDFPKNVEQYYWIHEGINDEEPWMTLCRLTNNAYVFYKGECDYTGFDCQGSMEIYSSMDPATLITFAMSICDYDKYIKDTSNSM